MQKLVRKSAAVIAISTLVVQGSLASDYLKFESDASGGGESLLSSVFHSPPIADVTPLDEQTMSDTQGELWPWILGVAAFDLSLASFYWGTYVPVTSAAGVGCINCDIGNKSK